MADAKKRVEIDVRTTGAQQAEADLKRLGESGDRGLRAIVGGAEAAGAALRLLGPVIGRVTVAATAGLALRQRHAARRRTQKHPGGDAVAGPGARRRTRHVRRRTAQGRF